MAPVQDRYDSELQMFVQPPSEPDLSRLRFLRWLGEQGLLEHELFGQASGAFARDVELEAVLAA